MQIDFPQIYHSWIDWIVKTTNLSDSVLHVHAGLFIFIVTRAVSQRSLGSAFPILIVFVAETINELLDWMHFGSIRLSDTIKDVFCTTFWPITVIVAIRLRPVHKNI